MSISILAAVFSDRDLQSDRIKLPFWELVEEVCQMFSTSFCSIKVPDDEMPAIFRLRPHLGDVVACKCKQCLPYRCIRVCLEVFNGADNHNYVLNHWTSTVLQLSSKTKETIQSDNQDIILVIIIWFIPTWWLRLPHG